MVIDEAQAAEANRLYWKQAASVGEIANQLGISRRALYDVLEPKPAGVRCPKCGTEGVFVNRSAQAAGLPRCPNCGTELEALQSSSATDSAHANPVSARMNGNGGGPRMRLGVGSAALAGVVIGAVATILLTQRD
jgi:ribosomal protein L37AE/L43A